MATRVLGLGLESDVSPDLVGLGLGLEPHTFRLGLDSRHAELGLGLRDSDRTRSAICAAENSIQVYLTSNIEKTSKRNGDRPIPLTRYRYVTS
jgi:hypothetical protein